MRKIKLMLFTLSAMTGIGTALYGQIPKSFGQTWYAITDGACCFTWTTIQPSLLLCATPKSCMLNTPNACTVQTTGGYTPVPCQKIPAIKIASLSNVGKIYR